ncbi:single-stranded DNA-binding protein [Neobacillus drentensis]|uniref:single-stranded DNA-binding protein n=1 Tax=Neobacillus drentensis TaxID=220684 RepID=UPI001F2CEACD|nr:single-stranded DNA-binding protein [Neobacillus drentensis]ULT55412.1 single-stranded DNA-binding protein [Neobacillus drentensis]
MNITTLIGRLTKEGDLKYSESGTAIYKNSIAVNRKFKKDEADFINLVAFQKTAELMANHLTKGDQVGIEGRIQIGSYEKDGKRIYTFDVVVDNITFIGSKKQDKPAPQPQTRVTEDPFNGYGAINIQDDDLPF